MKRDPNKEIRRYDDARMDEAARTRLRQLLPHAPLVIARHPDEWGVAAPDSELLALRLRGENRPCTMYCFHRNGELVPLSGEQDKGDG